jgi:hypothetical protein
MPNKTLILPPKFMDISINKNSAKKTKDLDIPIIKGIYG